MFLSTINLNTAAAASPAVPAAIVEAATTTESVNQPAQDADAQDMSAYVANYFTDTPILADIARCESHDRQFNPDGSVMRGSVVYQDVGIMQINETYHGTQAKSLGYDIYTLDGNLSFAKWLYDNQGTAPWASSSACWDK